MSEQPSGGWDQPGDDGILDDADTLASDDMTEDRLDAGIDPPDGYSVGERWGNTATEARQGEPLDQRLAEERPDPSSDPALYPAHDVAGSDPEAGQLIADRSAETTPGTASELPTDLADDQRSSEQAAIHVHGGTND
jgi:hypothetical protein